MKIFILLLTGSVFLLGGCGNTDAAIGRDSDSLSGVEQNKASQKQ